MLEKIYFQYSYKCRLNKQSCLFQLFRHFTLFNEESACNGVVIIDKNIPIDAQNIENDANSLATAWVDDEHLLIWGETGYRSIVVETTMLLFPALSRPK